MTLARRHLINTNCTPFYHVTSRCVRRAFLCGIDDISGNCYEHRRAWIENKLFELQACFSIDICAYAILSNHYHLVLHIDTDRAYRWSDQEVLRRWTTLFRPTVLIKNYMAGQTLSENEVICVKSLINVYRERLMSISWWMRILNESIAKKANAEDECTGHFWESRFKSQALVDETALIACMAYVDLNPIRAKLAWSPESSPFTSVKKRIHFLRQKRAEQTPLMPMDDTKKDTFDKSIPIKLHDYLRLVDETGRILHVKATGKIPTQLRPILHRLGISSQRWLALSTAFQAHYGQIAGSKQAIRLAKVLLDNHQSMSTLSSLGTNILDRQLV